MDKITGEMEETTLVSVTEAAERLSVSVTTVYRCVGLGAPIHRWGAGGRRYRIDVEEFRQWMESQEPEPYKRRGTVKDVAKLSGARDAWRQEHRADKHREG